MTVYNHVCVCNYSMTCTCMRCCYSSRHGPVRGGLLCVHVPTVYLYLYLAVTALGMGLCVAGCCVCTCTCTCTLCVAALGMGLCVAFIALVRLPSLKVSTLLLVGLLVYDVFWVGLHSLNVHVHVDTCACTCTCTCTLY